MENKNVLHPVKNSYFSLNYISGGCSHILWAVGWWSTPGSWGVGGGGGVLRISSDRDDQRSWAPVKGFFGVWNFWFWGSLSRLFFNSQNLCFCFSGYIILCFLEIFIARKFGMGSFWVLIFAPIRSSLSLKIRSTHPSWAGRMKVIIYPPWSWGSTQQAILLALD